MIKPLMSEETLHVYKKICVRLCDRSMVTNGVVCIELWLPLVLYRLLARGPKYEDAIVDRFDGFCKYVYSPRK